jgi:hypothetical protein
MKKKEFKWNRYKDRQPKTIKLVCVYLAESKRYIIGRHEENGSDTIWYTEFFGLYPCSNKDYWSYLPKLELN